MLVEIETAWSLSGYLLVCFSAGKSCPGNIKSVGGQGVAASSDPFMIDQKVSFFFLLVYNNLKNPITPINHHR